MPTLIFKIRYIYLFLILAFLSIIFLPSMHCTCKSTWWHHSVCNERWLECLCWCVWIFFPHSTYRWRNGAAGPPGLPPHPPSLPRTGRETSTADEKESRVRREVLWVGGWVWGGGEQQGERGRESIRQEKQGRREGWRGNMREQGDAETEVRLSEEGERGTRV